MSPPALLHSAFYRLAPLADPAALAATLRLVARGLKGSIVVAGEGLSGAVAGEPAAVEAFETALPSLLGPAGVGGIHFKRSACVTPPFGRMKVSVRPETVSLGLPDGASGGEGGRAAGAAQGGPAGLGLPPPDERDASHLAPAAWRALLARGEAVVLDNRNHFEVRLGHFRGAVDPQVHNFRDFVAFVQAQAPAWRAAGRPVAMYCTGGIRCDKTAPWLRSLGLQVWQLDGGILNYLAHIEDPGRDWWGECFVFDRRIALDAALRETPTTAAEVFDPRYPDEAWRLQRARRLDEPGAPGAPGAPDAPGD